MRSACPCAWSTTLAPSPSQRRASGAGKGCESLVGVTLGTGVGGGIVLDGRLVLGFHGTAGEIGHQVIDCTPGAPLCGCGNTGCLESLRRAAALASAAGTATAADAFAADERGDPRAHAAVEAWIDYLAIGLANVVTTLTPERIVLGGGVASAAARIIVPLARSPAHPRAPDRPRARRDRVRGARRARGRHRRGPARPRAGVARRPRTTGPVSLALLRCRSEPLRAVDFEPDQLEGLLPIRRTERAERVVTPKGAGRAEGALSEAVPQIEALAADRERPPPGRIRPAQLCRTWR